MRRRAPITVEPPASLRVFDHRGLEGADLRAAREQWGSDRAAFARRYGWPGGFLAELQQQVALDEQLRAKLWTT